jgi:hypothetical protein
MTKAKKLVGLLDRVTYYIEAIVAILLLLAVITLLAVMICNQIGIQVSALDIDFDNILSNVFTLVIGVEFTKMLCKHTAETVIEVLLFAIARQIVLSHGDALNMLLGVTAIAGLFAIKKYLIDNRKAS